MEHMYELRPSNVILGPRYEPIHILTLTVFLKNYFENVEFEKKSSDDII